jgi:hypothetical protein
MMKEHRVQSDQLEVLKEEWSVLKQTACQANAVVVSVVVARMLA